jgi:hypothetical protein
MSYNLLVVFCPCCKVVHLDFEFSLPLVEFCIYASSVSWLHNSGTSQAWNYLGLFESFHGHLLESSFF